MAAVYVGRKRARSHQSKPRVRHHDDDPYAMVVDDDNNAPELVIEHDPGDDADREDGDDDAVETYYSGSDSAPTAPPRRKRAMLIKANIQFLQKLPPLLNYQRSAYGRRGGVDGGTPDGDLSMTALEASMGESSVSTTSRPWFAAAAVAPVATSSSSRHPQQVTTTTLAAPQVHNVRRNASIAFASHAPRELIQQQQQRVNGRAGKDDEARPATTGARCW